MVQNAIDEWDVTDLDFSSSKTSATSSAPSAYDLGENLRVVLFSAVRPGMRILEVSANTDAGMHAWIDLLATSVESGTRRGRTPEPRSCLARG
jgi:hypothetical protein